MNRIVDHREDAVDYTDIHSRPEDNTLSVLSDPIPIQHAIHLKLPTTPIGKLEATPRGGYGTTSCYFHAGL